MDDCSGVNPKVANKFLCESCVVFPSLELPSSGVARILVWGGGGGGGGGGNVSIPAAT